MIQVLLKYEPDRIYVSIEDDGCGFDMENSDMDIMSRQDNSGFGLSMMRERVYLLSGNINIESKINHGTKIVVNVPIISKEEN
jgi:two-component system sensor histidine kinase DegS